MADAAVMFAPGGDRQPGSSPSDFLPFRPPPNSLKSLFDAKVVERCAPPRAICWEGEPALHVFHLLEGCLRIGRTLENGRRAILRFGHAGDLLCLSACDTYPFTAEAVTPIRFRRLSRRHFDDRVDGSADLRAQLHAEICSETRAAQEQIIRLGRTSADERVAAFLLGVAQRASAGVGPQTEIEVPFGRLDIADYLGLTVETISREISKLKHDGLISTSGPHRIVLRRVSRLREIAKTDANERVGAAPFAHGSGPSRSISRPQAPHRISEAHSGHGS